MYLVINNFILPNSIELVNEKGATFSILPLRKGGRGVLKMIDKIIKKNRIKIKKIKGIIIITDHSSFTRTRIVVTIANLISFFSNIPLSLIAAENIKDKKMEKIIKIGKRKLKKKMIFPVYNKQPNITITTINKE